jgi:DNA anti-recombination protein RmuC
VQQEKQKLNNDIGKLKKTYEQYQEQFKQLSGNYETAVKEKMLMKLEKDRLLAKVENLEHNLRQIQENQILEKKEKEDIQKRLEAKVSNTNKS